MNVELCKPVLGLVIDVGSGVSRPTKSPCCDKRNEGYCHVSIQFLYGLESFQISQCVGNTYLRPRVLASISWPGDPQLWRDRHMLKFIISAMLVLSTSTATFADQTFGDVPLKNGTFAYTFTGYCDGITLLQV